MITLNLILNEDCGEESDITSEYEIERQDDDSDIEQDDQAEKGIDAAEGENFFDGEVSPLPAFGSSKTPKKLLSRLP
ncbi:hypothetical protein TNCT_737121 [Trichonephila clavata]|uniref:Uncharacterized protein n=1 Tax=Trichonephila clavata TaxID=2740835 RepID=A0A8X6LWV9_TRICU|nr:hypothetical protein TNCT_737121 [Trichonephila clavata]